MEDVLNRLVPPSCICEPGQCDGEFEIVTIGSKVGYDKVLRLLSPWKSSIFDSVSNKFLMRAKSLRLSRTCLKSDEFCRGRCARHEVLRLSTFAFPD